MRQLDLNHFDLFLLRGGGEALGVEAAIFVAAAKVTGAQLPDEVAPLLVIGRHRALARVMSKPANARADIQRLDGVGRQRAETHARNIEYRQGIRLLSAGPDSNAEILAVQLRRRHGVVDPLVPHFVQFEFGSEGATVGHAFGALVDDTALKAGEWHLVGIRVHQILLDFRPDGFYQVAKMSHNGIVAQHSMPALQDVMYAECRNEQWRNNIAPVPAPESRAGQAQA